jgi:prepilin-type processing-associated H-X9-DG protein
MSSLQSQYQGYGHNMFIAYGRNYREGTTEGDIPNPAEIFCIFDMTGNAWPYDIQCPAAWGGPALTMPHDRHQEMFNATFCDGHAKACKWSQYYYGGSRGDYPYWS